MARFARSSIARRQARFHTSQFDWWARFTSGVQGHEYYGKWFQKIDPNVRDIAYEGDLVVSGLTPRYGDRWRSLGRRGWRWDTQTKPGGTFIKIVGVLRKVDDTRYHHSKPYEIVDGGKWSVKKSRDSVAFTHVLRDPSSGYSYDYRKTVSLTKGKPEMVVPMS
jgi:hypothetical protein